MTSLLQTLKQLVSPGGIEGYLAVKYAEFARDTPSMRDEYRRLAAKTASVIQAGRVLEIGPGPGFIAIEIAKWQRPAQIFEVYQLLKPGCRALIADPRADAPVAEVKAFAGQIDSWFMRWGLRHSFWEDYTVQEAEQLVDDIPFASARTEVDGISMAIWLEK